MTDVNLRGNTLYVTDVKVGASDTNDAGASVVTSDTAQTISAQKTFTAGINTKQSVAGVHDTTPTDAELDSAFGTPATLGRGFVGLVDDADGDTNGYICWTSDASWYFIKGTKAT